MPLHIFETNCNLLIMIGSSLFTSMTIHGFEPKCKTYNNKIYM